MSFAEGEAHDLPARLGAGGIWRERSHGNSTQVRLEKPRQLPWGFCQCWLREMGTDLICRERRCPGQMNLDVGIQSRDRDTWGSGQVV